MSGIIEEIKTCVMGVEPVEVSYPEKGYHCALEASADKLSDVVRFFDEKRFYLECLLCTDYVDYLELVYLFICIDKLPGGFRSTEADELRFWTKREMEKNTGTGIFTESLEYEYAQLKKLKLI